MLQVRRPPIGTRSKSGKLDILVIALISLLIVLALLYVLFQIINHSEEHVEAVRKTKVIYNESLRWRPDSELCETRISNDLIKFPNRKKAEYTDLNLNEKCLELMGRMNRLEELKLTRSTVQDPWLAHLSQLRVRSLGVHGTPLTDKAIPYILQLQNLNELSIGDTELTDKGLELLSASKSIENLTLSLARCVTNDGIKHVEKMTQLTRLQLSNPVVVTGKCLAYLTNLKLLSALDIENMPLTAKDLTPLSNLKNLRSLNISNCRLNDKSLDEIAKITSLQNLDLTGSDFTDKGLMSLTKLKILSHLTIKDCPNVGDAAVKKFQSTMPACHVQHSNASHFSEQLSRPNFKQDVDFLEDEVKKELEKTKDTTD